MRKTSSVRRRLHRPADDPTAERIEHDSEIQEAAHRRDIGDVGDPKLVGAVGGEITVHQVRRRARVAIPPGGDDATAAADADNPCRPHQPGNPLLADGPTFGTQLGMNSRRTIGAARDSMDRAHSSEQRIIGDGPCRREARTPSIVAGR